MTANCLSTSRLLAAGQRVPLGPHHVPLGPWHWALLWNISPHQTEITLRKGELHTITTGHILLHSLSVLYCTVLYCTVLYCVAGYIRGAAALVVIGLLFDFFGTLLTGLGLRSTDPNKKYKYYRVAIYALIVARKRFSWVGILEKLFTFQWSLCSWLPSSTPSSSPRTSLMVRILVTSRTEPGGSDRDPPALEMRNRRISFSSSSLLR